MLTRKTMWITCLAASTVSALLIGRAVLGQDYGVDVPPVGLLEQPGSFESSRPAVAEYPTAIRSDAFAVSTKATVASDPEMRKLLEEDEKMEKQAEVIAQRFRTIADTARRVVARTELEQLTKTHFDLRQKRRELEISRLEDQLKRVRESLKKREDAKDLIIKRRIAKLLGEHDDLAF